MTGQSGSGLLRPTQPEDFDAWAEFMADPEATRFLGGALLRTAAWRGFLTMAGAWTIQGFSNFSVIEKATGRWVGRLGPWQPEGWPGTEVGWGLCRDAWGKGYATEGGAAAIDWAFDQLGWTEVIHCIAPDNEPSKAVARRLGSRFRGLDRLPPPIDTQVEIWGQTREEWRSRAAGRRP
ncbi:GNAT family N-acetyltransferase [Inquilinus sp.]|uniref:GNAT family N-acetyltransferase n=1 Tax=Inquilinus sp. TaxID=1932117 RepID=UPI003784D451